VPNQGRAVAARFAKEYPVVLLARSPESYQDAVDAISTAGGKAIGISTDAADVKSIDAAFEAIKKEFPDHKLAAAVYNVGPRIQRVPFLEATIEDFDNSISGNA
jgi:NAD(P)-dependent dehydrogenase (short-subunit alcohol dehydrogenase family)